MAGKRATRRKLSAYERDVMDGKAVGKHAQDILGKLEEILEDQTLNTEHERARRLKESISQGKELDAPHLRHDTQEYRRAGSHSIGSQKRYSSVSPGDVLEIYQAEESRSGTSDLTKGIGPGGLRVFIGGSLKPGWSGTVMVERQIGEKPLYFCRPVEQAAEPAPRQRTPEPKSIDTTVKSPAYVPEKPGYKPEVEERPAIVIGDVGATESERARVYVPAQAVAMKVLEGIAYVIRNGQAASPQGKSVLAAMRSHLDSGKPLYEVAGEVPDQDMTLGQYLDRYSQGLEVGIGEKQEEVRTPAAADIVDKPRPRTRPKSRSRPAKPKKDLPVGVGSRRSGAAQDLYQIVQQEMPNSSYRR